MYPIEQIAPRPTLAASYGALLKFFGLFLLVFTLLMSPWSGFKEGYAAGFRTVGNIAFTSFGSTGRVRFEPSSEGDRRHDTVLILINTATGVGSQAPTSSRFMGYVPTALVLALVLATPLPWRRRLTAAAWGLLWVNLFVLFRLLLSLLNDFQGAAPSDLYSLGPMAAKCLYFAYLVLAGSAAGAFIVPVLIAASVCFHGGAWSGFVSGDRNAASVHSGHPLKSGGRRRRM